MSLLILDNHDSFTYNLVQLVEQCGCTDYQVIKTSALNFSVAEGYDAVIISPGPGLPSETPNLMEFISACHRTKIILGICLGHQAIAEFFGATLFRLTMPAHGISSEVLLQPGDPLFAGMPQTIQAGRYHSWLIDPLRLPSCLKVTALSTKGEIMGIRHKELNISGLQFHPESVITEAGKQIISNFCLSILPGKQCLPK